MAGYTDEMESVMGVDSKVLLAQIDAVLAKAPAHRDGGRLDDKLCSEVTASCIATIERIVPAGHTYRHQAAKILDKYGQSNSYGLAQLTGVVSSLRNDLVAGYLKSLEELIHADLFSDFLQMAEHLLQEGYKDPAAVIAGGVLEEHLRKLCQKNQIPTDENGKPKKVDKLNADLAAAKVYNLLEQKSVTSWLDLRNKAAHGRYGEYDKGQVGLLCEGITQFLTRNPA